MKNCVEKGDVLGDKIAVKVFGGNNHSTTLTKKKKEIKLL